MEKTVYSGGAAKSERMEISRLSSPFFFRIMVGESDMEKWVRGFKFLFFFLVATASLVAPPCPSIS